MSSGSYFTLYRKYNVHVPEEKLKSIISGYAKENMEHDYSDKKKPYEEYEKDIPLILEPLHRIPESTYDETTNTWNDNRDHSIDGQRNAFKAILSTDGSNLDELLNWNFNSSFTCLKNEWCMNGYKWSGSQHIIDEYTAKMMLQACKYLLSGKWSDEFESILDNSWIRIFASGNDSFNMYRYLYRNNPERLKELEITEEEDESVRFMLEQTSRALEAYLCSCKDYNKDDYEFLLVYTAY